jgi:acetyltransferase EpsM
MAASADCLGRLTPGKASSPGKVIIWGAGGHAKVVADILLRTGFILAGLIDEARPIHRPAMFGGTMVLGGAAELAAAYASGIRQGIVGFGDNTRRLVAGETLVSHGFDLVRAIHPSAVLAMDTTVGAGSMIAAGAVIGPSTVIGRCVIVNTRASVDHDCIVHDGVHVGPGANLAGYVEIGVGAWIGIGATVIDRKRIGAGSIVGAGAVVVTDVPDGVIVMGVPARIARRVDEVRRL